MILLSNRIGNLCYDLGEGYGLAEMYIPLLVDGYC